VARLIRRPPCVQLDHPWWLSIHRRRRSVSSRGFTSPAPPRRNATEAEVMHLSSQPIHQSQRWIPSGGSFSPPVAAAGFRASDTGRAAESPLPLPPPLLHCDIGGIPGLPADGLVAFFAIRDQCRTSIERPRPAATRRAKPSAVRNCTKGRVRHPVNTAGSPPRHRAWQASDRWNRSSEPMQCIGKTPVRENGKDNPSENARTTRQDEVIQRGCVTPGTCCSAMG
jgi:hypothetical protein